MDTRLLSLLAVLLVVKSILLDLRGKSIASGLAMVAAVICLTACASPADRQFSDLQTILEYQARSR